jgi:hypothetical protein
MPEIFNTIPPTARFLKGRVRVGATRTARPAQGADRGTPADLHRPRPTGHRDHHRLREKVLSGLAPKCAQTTIRSSLQTLPAYYILWAGARPDRTEKTACNLPADTPERVKISAS